MTVKLRMFMHEMCIENLKMQKYTEYEQYEKIYKILQQIVIFNS